MRLLLSALLLTVSASAASFSINPVAAAKALHAKTPVSTKLRRITGAIALGGNGLDWYQTVRYAGPGGHGCEQNPLLVTAPCQLNVPKFRAVKAAVSLAILAEELPHIFHSSHVEEWDKIGLIANVPLDGLFVVLTVHNAASIRQINGRSVLP